ncbi:NAD(+) diphosphatase [Pseudooceanicola aestuarii]|uniref:NAD(+) diphosphatase n=1 Tax=Pseudooceanicola aestuarii TaxID=2697319 RepID=UPI0013D21132|nr:NAD(+) diphosphatase [Pseudooceanicola aestuarii]
MRIAEEVTFGGSGLDRAAELRGQADVLRFARSAGTSRTALFWRGNVLMSGPGTVARLPMNHPVLADAREEPILMGRDGDGLLFASDISGWTPEGDPFAEPAPGWAAPELPQHPALDPALVLADLRSVMARLAPRDAEIATTARALMNWHRSHRFCASCGQPSEVTQAGWQRNCPACRTPHFPRTDPVVIMLITSGDKTLLGRSPGWPPGMYSMLAGFVEPGEPIEAAVRREVMEETQVPVGRVRYLASQPWAFPNSLMFACHGEALAEDITLDPVELDDALWLPREEMGNVFAGTHPTIKQPRRGAIAEFILRNWLADRLD